MGSIKDDKGHNQGFNLVPSTIIRMKRRAQFFLEAMTKSGSKKILEIGCGTGEIAYWMAQKDPTIEMTGTDICKPFIEQAKRKYTLNNLEYRHLDITDFKEDAEKYDYIIGNGILHHVYPTLDLVLSDLKNKLKDNGRLVFMEPNIYNPYCLLIFKVPFLRKWANLEDDEMAFSRNFIINKLNQGGFTKIDVRFKDFLIPGVPMAMVNPIIKSEKLLESFPFTKIFSQSLFIQAEKSNA